MINANALLDPHDRDPTQAGSTGHILDKSLPLPDCADRVLTVAELPGDALPALIRRYGLQYASVPADTIIPGSFWGEREAGLRGCCLYARADTPVHSALHELCHLICMTPDRRAALDTDAGGDDHEEDAVCYLQILLADALPGMGRPRMLRDMDDWGYTFRLGSAERWFHEDAQEARDWLQQRGLIDADGTPTFCLNECSA